MGIAKNGLHRSMMGVDFDKIGLLVLNGSGPKTSFWNVVRGSNVAIWDPMWTWRREGVRKSTVFGGMGADFEKNTVRDHGSGERIAIYV